MRLSDLPVLFLDLQTTGATPLSGHILEVALASTNSDAQSFIVSLPPDVELPRRIQMVTGIKESDLQNAIELEIILDKIRRSEEKNCIIHFAQFETPFLLNAFNHELPFKIICTHEITKRLYPNLPSRGIKALAGFFGINTGDFKRASSHVEATKLIWRKCIEALEQMNVTTLAELEVWLQVTPKVKRKKLEYPLPKEKRLDLPDCPGIYKMKNAKGEILYVGKATSLFDRVNSYFRGQKKRDARKLEMLAQVYDIEVVPCVSPLAAALLETDEIKRLNPYYNIALKVGHRAIVFFNRHFTSMSPVYSEEHFIGPFSSVSALDSVLNLCTFLNQEEQELPPPDLFFEILEPALILDGLNELIKRHGLKTENLKSMRSILALGLKWHKRKIKEEALKTEETIIAEENEEDILLEEVNATDIADKFERHFMRFARAYLKALTLQKLFYAHITYREKDGSFQTLAPQAENSWNIDPIHTYDRLMVLSTELSRISTQGGQWHIISPF